MSRPRTASALTLVAAIVIGPQGAASASAASSPGASAALPVFAPDEPLVLAPRFTADGGGILVKRPDGSGAVRGWEDPTAPALIE